MSFDQILDLTADVFFIRAKRVSNCYIQKKNCVRLRLILVLVGKNLCVCSPDFCFSATTVWYQVRIMYQIRMYLVSAGRNLYVRTWRYAITRTFRPLTHTSDDSYIYQLSLVVATATVSFYNTCYPSIYAGYIVSVRRMVIDNIVLVKSCFWRW